jgi:hypothetical protein
MEEKQHGKRKEQKIYTYLFLMKYSLRRRKKKIKKEI